MLNYGIHRVNVPGPAWIPVLAAQRALSDGPIRAASGSSLGGFILDILN